MPRKKAVEVKPEVEYSPDVASDMPDYMNDAMIDA